MESKKRKDHTCERHLIAAMVFSLQYDERFSESPVPPMCVFVFVFVCAHRFLGRLQALLGRHKLGSIR